MRFITSFMFGQLSFRSVCVTLETDGGKLLVFSFLQAISVTIMFLTPMMWMLAILYLTYFHQLDMTGNPRSILSASWSLTWFMPLTIHCTDGASAQLQILL